MDPTPPPPPSPPEVDAYPRIVRRLAHYHLAAAVYLALNWGLLEPFWFWRVVSVVYGLAIGSTIRVFLTHSYYLNTNDESIQAVRSGFALGAGVWILGLCLDWRLDFLVRACLLFAHLLCASILNLSPILPARLRERYDNIRAEFPKKPHSTILALATGRIPAGAKYLKEVVATGKPPQKKWIQRTLQ